MLDLTLAINSLDFRVRQLCQLIFAMWRERFSIACLVEVESAVVKSRLVIETFFIKSRASNNFWSTFSFPHRRRRRRISVNWSSQNEQLNANFSIKSSSSSSLPSCELFSRSTETWLRPSLHLCQLHVTTFWVKFRRPADFPGTNRNRVVYW